MFDDMIDTGGTTRTGAERLKEAGARKVYLAATHAILSGAALEHLSDEVIDGIIVTDTLPVTAAKEYLKDKLRVVSVAPLIGEAIFQIVTDGSISKIFADQNHL
jgi:ribose-phosphate pyrophosphokinase